MKKIFSIIIRVTMFVVIMAMLTIGITKHMSKLFVEESKVPQETISTQRVVANPVELIAIADRIIDTNIKIARYREYYNKPILSLFFCKEFKDLDMIK